MLTQHNGSLGAKSFPEKKGKAGQSNPCYITSGLFQERDLGEFKNWNEVNLLKRRKQLVTWARERWAVPAQVNVTQPEPPATAEDEEAEA